MRLNREEEAEGHRSGAAEEGRGLPRKPRRSRHRRWWEILKRVALDIGRKNLSLVAAGAAFYAFLAIPSAAAALVSLYGLAFNPQDVRRQVLSMVGFVPNAAITLIAGELTSLTRRSAPTLGIGLLLSIAIALWSATYGTTSMMSALTIAYDETEKRGLLRYYATAFALTVTVVLFAAVALALIAILPSVIGMLPFAGLAGPAGPDRIVASVIRWPVLALLLLLVLAVLFRYAPSRKAPKWQWVSWGSLAAALLWLAGSALFSLYIGEFASYDKTYGSLGAVVALLMWLYLSAYAVLIGARLNAEIERRRRPPAKK